MTKNTDRFLLALSAALWTAMITCSSGCDDAAEYDDHSDLADVTRVATRPRNTVAPTPPGFDQASAIIRGELSRHLEFNMPKPPPILWFEGDSLIYNDADLKRTILGRYRGPEIDLIDLGADSLCDTALTHELAHWSLHMATGDAEFDHEGSDLWAPGVLDDLCRRTGL